MDNDLIKKDNKQFQATYDEVRNYIVMAQNKVSSVVNAAMVRAYWQIGKKIYEICNNKERAKYKESIIDKLSEKLTKEFGKGFSIQNLRRMRQFYLMFPNRATVWSELSWSHYRLLITVKDKKAREFYAQECMVSNWSVRQLERQINTFYYQRILARQNKDNLSQEMEKKISKPDYDKIIKDPYVLEFLDLKPDAHFYESDLEQALINHLQNFLLELGRGYSFVSRQKHFQIDDDHFYIDLVFYNYMMKCFVLIDLKLGKLTHQDLGQMQMYVNYYTRELMNEGDNLPIGIVLCADKNDTLVKYTLPKENSQIYAAKYVACLPTEEEFKKEIKLDEFKRIEK